MFTDYYAGCYTVLVLVQRRVAKLLTSSLGVLTTVYSVDIDFPRPQRKVVHKADGGAISQILSELPERIVDSETGLEREVF